MPWGVAAAGIGAAGSIYAANKNANTTTQNTTQTPQLTAATNAALTQGTAISQRPYTPYSGSVVAPLSQNEGIASGLAQTGGTQAQSYLTSAGQELSGIKDYNTSNLQSYMDPYIASTLTPTLRAENMNYEQQASALQNSKAGAFGGDREALAESALSRTHGQQIAADVSNAYSNAYTNAQTAFFNDQQKTINTANALANVGNDVSKLNTQQIQDLMATGGIQRALSQAQLDFNYQQFVENRDWSVNNLQPLLNSIAAAKGANMTTTTIGPQSGIAGEAIGAAATIAGAYFTGGKSVNNNSGSSNNPSNPSYWGGSTMPTDQGQTTGTGPSATVGYDPSLEPGMVYNG